MDFHFRASNAEGTVADCLAADRGFVGWADSGDAGWWHGIEVDENPAGMSPGAVVPAEEFYASGPGGEDEVGISECRFELGGGGGCQGCIGMPSLNGGTAGGRTVF